MVANDTSLAVVEAVTPSFLFAVVNQGRPLLLWDQDGRYGL